jgi:hypothetical protein
MGLPTATSAHCQLPLVLLSVLRVPLCLPGKYTTDQLLSMSAEAAKRAAAASRRGAFGTAVSSGRSLSVVDQALGFGGSGPHVPGPGCYDVRVGLADSVAAAAVRPSAVSLGVVRLCVVVGHLC